MKLSKEQTEKLLLQPTPVFRVSHPHVFKPVEFKGNLNYSIEMLFDKETTDLSILQAPIRMAKIFMWGKDKTQWPEKLRSPIKDGDKPVMNKKTRKKEVKPEHAGMWVVKASTSAKYNRPQVVGADGETPLENEGDLYPGCYGRAGLKAHAYEISEETSGVKFILDAVQFVEDGDPLTARKSAKEIFGSVEDGDENDFDSDDDNDSEENHSFM